MVRTTESRSRRTASLGKRRTRKPWRFEAAGAVGVLRDGEVVGGAVDLDHQAGGEADEVDDVAVEAVLAAEGAVGDALAAELEPQAGFGGAFGSGGGI